MRTNEVGDALAAVDAAVSRLARLDTDDMPHTELLASLRAAHRLVNRMEAQRTRLVSSVRARGAVVFEQAPSTAVWLRTELRLGDGVAQLRAATVTEVLPSIAMVYGRGDTSLAHVAVIASVAREFRPLELARADRLFARDAARLTPQALRRAAGYIRSEVR